MAMTGTPRLQAGQPRADGARSGEPALVAAQVSQGQAGGRPPAGKEPAGPPVLTRDEIAYLVTLAARAPSVHNSQPWLFRLCGDALELYADLGRMLPHADPDGREMLISCGAALFGLRLGLRKLGYAAHVTVLPDAAGTARLAAPATPARPAQLFLVARVRPAGRAATTRQEWDLLAAVPHRHTHDGRFAPGLVSPRLLAALCEDAVAERAELILVEHRDQLRELARLVSAAADEQRGSVAVSADRQRWMRPGGPQASESVRESAWAGREDPDGQLSPATAVLVTASDTAADWIAAGQALHRLLLHAATRWVFASLNTQPLESPRFRAQIRARLRLTGAPQMLLKLGRANTTPAAPRRPARELMTAGQELAASAAIVPAPPGQD
jgi:nitroreductase